MSIKKTIERELQFEREMYKHCKRNLRKSGFFSLSCKYKNGTPQFYIRTKGSRKEKYVRRSAYPKLEKMYEERINMEIAETLRNNIAALSKLLTKIEDYDSDAAGERLPLAFRRLKGVLYDEERKRQESSIAFPQSENTKDRAGLKFRTSFGLFVRSKNEMLIAEALYAAGLEFWYEKRLELAVKSSGGYNIEAVYPDFTIRLPDGSIMYWEHFGMMDKKDYQEENYRRLQKYLANGIYPPHNMIMTFDGENMPFDNGAVWRIIQGQLLG